MITICKFICALIILLSSTTLRSCVNCEKRFRLIAIVAKITKFVIHLLNVVETGFRLEMTTICKFICALITLLSSTTVRFRVNRKKTFFAIMIVTKFVTQLLKVVETWLWS